MAYNHGDTEELQVRAPKLPSRGSHKSSHESVSTKSESEMPERTRTPHSDASHTGTIVDEYDSHCQRLGTVATQLGRGQVHRLTTERRPRERPTSSTSPVAGGTASIIEWYRQSQRASHAAPPHGSFRIQPLIQCDNLQDFIDGLLKPKGSWNLPTGV
jgi:hypothetical protein